LKFEILGGYLDKILIEIWVSFSEILCEIEILVSISVNFTGAIK